jgi:hypothetical protein
MVQKKEEEGKGKQKQKEFSETTYTNKNAIEQKEELASQKLELLLKTLHWEVCRTPSLPCCLGGS